MSIELKEAEIKNILAEVTASLQAAKKSEAEKLIKALDGEESAPAGDESAPAAESAAPAAPEASGSAPADAPDMGSAPAESAPAESAAPADPAAADPAASADPAAEQSAEVTDPAVLMPEYAKLSDAGLKAHYMACKQAVFERMQGAASAGPDASVPPAPDASAVASPPAAGASPAMKTEGMPDKGNIDPVTKPGSQSLDQATGPGASLSAKTVETSEASQVGGVEKEVAKSESEKDQVIEGLVKAVNLLINGPQIRKAVTSVAYVERSESLEKSEKPAAKKLAPEAMKAHLSELIRSGKLNKSEKAAVLSFYETKNPSHLEKIAHLFE
jgi:hypothetical protein